jgi:hypothetical protein
MFKIEYVNILIKLCNKLETLQKMCLSFFTVKKIEGWKTTINSQVGRLKRKMKGTTGQAPDHWSDRSKFLWKHARFLAEKIRPRTYTVKEVGVGICNQLVTLYGILVIHKCDSCLTNVKMGARTQHFPSSSVAELLPGVCCGREIWSATALSPQWSLPVR